MKRCYLCGRTTNLTQEHIWSHSVIREFPDAPLTLDEYRGKVFAAEPTIGDVCNDCNKGLSKYDAYMATLTHQHLTKPLLGKPVVLDLQKLARWILKTSANHSRSTKEKNEWWREYTDFMRFDGDLPINIDFFGAPWDDPRPVNLQRMLPVKTLDAMSVLLNKVKKPSWEHLSAYFNGGWALKIGYSVFMFINYEPTIPDKTRDQLRDSIRGFGWSLLGIDAFPKSSPFNLYTCVKYSIICDPSRSSDPSFWDEAN